MVYPIALTIKPTMSCNMRCRHCFNGNALNTPEFLPVQTACRFLELAARDFPEIKVTFHGGEPSLAGYEFYREFYELEQRLSKEKNTLFSNLFTTNGLDLNEQLMDLLIMHDTLINISFDGPCNDVLRSNTEAVWRNICKLREKNARMRIFCTIAAPSYPHLEEIYNWFRERSLDFKILPIEPRGFARENSELIMNPDAFVEELIRTYRLWATDTDCPIRVYTFLEFAALRRNIQFKPFWFNREIALNPDGKIYPFGRPNDVQFCLGRPEEIECLIDCFHTPEYCQMREVLEQEQETRCQRCGSFHICRGVCVCMSYMYSDTPWALEYSCRLSNNIFESVLRTNDDISNDFRCGNGDRYNHFVKELFSVINDGEKQA